MKKIMLAASCLAFVVACSSNSNSEYDHYYNDKNAATETDSAATTNIVAATRQSEVDTNRTNIGTDRSAGVSSENTAQTTTSASGTEAGKAKQTTTTSGSEASKTQQATALQGNYEKGMKLIEMSDCLACHKVEDKLVGPSYQDVAGKYEFNDKNVDYLAQKIIKGGSGVWGQIPMSPHPDLKVADAKEMAKYILSLKKK